MMMKLLYVPGDYRCGVKRADYAFPEEKCYCFEKDLQGVKTGFWHIMEVCIECNFLYVTLVDFQSLEKKLKKNWGKVVLMEMIYDTLK